jgi:hypothetical protein
LSPPDLFSYKVREPDFQPDVRTRAPNVAEFVRACSTGNVETLRDLLGCDPGLARERVMAGRTGLHLAVRHPDASAS